MKTTTTRHQQLTMKNVRNDLTLNKEFLFLISISSRGSKGSPECKIVRN